MPGDLHSKGCGDTGHHSSSSPDDSQSADLTAELDALIVQVG
jgi:hypothetical protein